MAFTHTMAKYADNSAAIVAIKNTMVTAGWTVRADFATIAAGLSNVANNTAYSLGDMRLPVVSGYSNVILVCTQAGTTHASTAITPSSTFTGEITSGTAKFKTIWKQAYIMSCSPSYTSPTGYLYIGLVTVNAPFGFNVFSFAGYLPNNSSGLIFYCPNYNLTALNTLYLSYSPYYTDTWADSTSVCVNSQENTSNNFRFFAGFPATDSINDTTTATAPATAGSSVSVSVANALKFQPNKSYRWYASDGSWREKFTVSSVTNSTTIVISTLRTNIPSGAYIGSLPNMFLCSRCDSNYHVTHLFDNSLTTDINSAAYVSSSVNTSLLQYSVTAIGYHNNRYSLTPFCMVSDGAAIGMAPSWMAYQSSGSTLGDIFGVGENYRGSASAGGNTTMTDAAATWTTNQWAGKRLCLTSGTGSGQTRAITSNSATQITVTNAWGTNPVSGTTYTICDSSWRHAQGAPFINVTTTKFKEGH